MAGVSTNTRAVDGAASTLSALALLGLPSLVLRARALIDGALVGLHRSALRGASVEFAEHKEYAPGDELRHVDWKAYGKLDKYYVKRYEAETELTALLVVDRSASMGYAGKSGVSKLDYARLLAAALSALLIGQQDRVGLVTFADRPQTVPPRGGTPHLSDLLTALDRLVPQGASDLPAALAALSERAARRSLIIVLSDLFDQDDVAVQHLLRSLRARQHDVVVWHVLDGDELTLPFDQPTQFEALEPVAAAEPLLCDPESVRADYLAELERFTSGYRRALGDGDVEYLLADTRRPPAAVLRELLRGGRGKRTR